MVQPYANGWYRPRLAIARIRSCGPFRVFLPLTTEDPGTGGPFLGWSEWFAGRAGYPSAGADQGTGLIQVFDLKQLYYLGNQIRWAV
jgi:hypothetical protein